MNDDKLARVRKLLAQADSVAGTPEADVFNAKAFDLIARYGLDETQARMQDTTGPTPVERYEFTPTGSYQRQQGFLFYVLAKALHCAAIGTTGGFVVFGTATNLDRLKLLFASLQVQMFSGAATVGRGTGGATRRARLSWMYGFAESVGDRLGVAERAAADDVTGAELVHLDDARRPPFRPHRRGHRRHRQQADDCPPRPHRIAGDWTTPISAGGAPRTRGVHHQSPHHCRGSRMKAAGPGSLPGPAVCA
ncbi:DUF2786 domain-containing protein [Prescottella subtropica]|uniref:DUF2786 domain-containing protein n=1 Tax=Prescottella subtropica TaxID=2545757 RepID=UPI00138737B0|nr:DUF2786 domain-containing protein [Prescottella subtropica]